MNIEPFDSDDEFHRLLQHQNTTHGAGLIECVIWDTDNRSGIAVCQLQYGLSTREFQVRKVKPGFALTFLRGITYHVSEYFNEP